VSARKIGFLLLLLLFGAFVETAWQVRGDWRIGPEGCRVIRGRFYGPSYAFEQTAERVLAPGERPRLEIENAFGGVIVTAGAPGVVKVKLRKVVFLPTEERARAFADRVELRLSGEGARVKVGTNREDVGRGEDVGFETHLEIETPTQTAVEVRSEHGRVDVSGVASADVVSSFDGVAVERVAGSVKLEVRNGDVRASGTGALELDARHGNVEISDVSGASRIEVEHGDLSIRQTGALDVGIRYGGLTAERVDGDLVVRGGHAELRASDVTGRAELETSYAGIRLARVAGEVRATAQHGEVAAQDVGGSLFAETTHAAVSLERVDGAVQAIADHGGVEASGLARGAKVRASGGDVSLDGFLGPVEVDVERGSARLSPRAPVTSAITASATNGEIRLDVPEGSRFDLDAEAKRGELQVDVPGLVSSTARGEAARGRRVTGSFGGGGVPVRLSADGDVVLEAKPTSAIAERGRAKPATAAPTPPAEAVPEKPAPGAPPAPEAPPRPEAPSGR
jgi:DUF4097 and DUF4098 domain-containing protein YvlB